MSLFGGEEKAILKAMGYTPIKEIISLQGFSFPQVVSERAQRELGCTDDQMELVEIALLDYFLEVKLSRNVPMVDKNADILWHTFLLDTKAYMRFCSMHIGFYVHHVPYSDDMEINAHDKYDEEDRLDRIQRVDPLYFYGRRKRAVDKSENDDLHTFLPMYALIDTADDLDYKLSEPDRKGPTTHHSEPVDHGNPPCTESSSCSNDSWGGHGGSSSSSSCGGSD